MQVNKFDGLGMSVFQKVRLWVGPAFCGQGLLPPLSNIGTLLQSPSFLKLSSLRFALNSLTSPLTSLADSSPSPPPLLPLSSPLSTGSLSETPSPAEFGSSTTPPHLV